MTEDALNVCEDGIDATIYVSREYRTESGV